MNIDFTEKTENNCASCFKPDGFAGSTLYSGGRLTIGYYRCICGEKEHASWCDGKSHLWKSWTEKATLPAKDHYFYLTNNVKLTNQCVIKEKQEVTLDLRGYKIYGKNNVLPGIDQSPVKVKNSTFKVFNIHIILQKHIY